MNTTGEVRETGGQSVSALEGLGAGSVTVNVAGQSLDDARAEFRAAWQERLDRRKRRATRAENLSAELFGAVETITLVGMLCGAATASIVFLVLGGIRDFFISTLFGLPMGGMLGLMVVTPLVWIIRVSAWLCRRYAARLERAVYELDQL